MAATQLESALSAFVHDGDVVKLPLRTFATVFVLASLVAGCSRADADEEAIETDKLLFDATWSPDGSRVAFAGGSFGQHIGLFVMSIDGTKLARLTPNFMDAGGPRWSPDGRRLVFVTGTDDLGLTSDRDLYVVRADGTGLTRLTRNDVDDTMAEWSPDGRQIAFSCHRDGSYDLCTIRPDGTGLRRLTKGRAMDRSPTWSPDGAWVGFTREDHDVRVCVIRSDGTDLRCPARVSASDYLSWSPAGDLLAAESNGVAVVDARSGAARRLVRGGELFSDPSWSRDGRRLVFQIGEDVYSKKRIVLADVRRHRLRELGLGWGEMSWSPDGRRLVLSSVNELYLIDVETGQRTVLETPLPEAS